MSRPPLEIGGVTVRGGRRAQVELPVAKLVTGSPLTLPLLVFHGNEDGPTVWLSAAIHGDELNGVEVVRRVGERLKGRTLHGTVLAVPVVNTPGFMTGDRYLPDRRDLNRSFPGSRAGSLAARIANVFMTEIVARSAVGIDLHTGSAHRSNLPQIRADLRDDETRRLATAFGAPVMLSSDNRRGSLRHAGTEAGRTVLLYEAGEAWRFDEASIATGVRGVVNVLTELGMLEPDPGDSTEAVIPIECDRSRWVRARRSGLVTLWNGLGDQVAGGQPIGQINDTFGRRLSRITAPVDGIVIGETRDPVVNQGDALVHIAQPIDTAKDIS